MIDDMRQDEDGSGSEADIDDGNEALITDEGSGDDDDNNDSDDNAEDFVENVTRRKKAVAMGAVVVAGKSVSVSTRSTVKSAKGLMNKTY